MSPNFAFAISQETLRLLIRVDGGWAELGNVSTTAPDMAERLADLRDEAAKRAPLGIATKLIIPNDYIRYMTLPATQTGEDAVRRALDGATPYDVDELVIDHETDASGTHVAAVTEEFLIEAEKFALDHGLGPVSFVAIPREGSFDREVFFGKTRGADRLLPGGAELGPEHEPMTIVPLPAATPRGAVFASSRRHEVPTPQEASEALQTPPAPVQSEAAAPKPAPAPADPKPAAAEPIAAQDAAPAPQTEAPSVKPRLSPQPALRAPRDEKPQQKAETQAPPAKRTVSFSAKSRAAKADEPPAPLPEDSAKAVAELSAAIAARTPEPQGPDVPKTLFVSKARPKKRATAPAKAPVLRSGKSAQPVFSARRAPVAEPDGLGVGMAATPAPAPEQEGPRLGLIAAAVVGLVALLGGGLWALRSTAPSDAIDIAAIEAATLQSALPDSAPVSASTADITQPTAPDASSAPAPASTPDVDIASVTALDPPAQTAPPQTGVTVMPTNPRVLSDDEARRRYAATGVWQKSPAVPQHPRDAQLSFARPFSAQAMPRATTPSYASDGLRTDLVALTPPPPPAPGQSIALGSDGFVVPTPEGALSASGILAFAGRPALVPPTRPGTEPPAAAPAQTPPPTRPAAAASAARADGLVIAQGPPPLVPPSRPANAALPTSETPPADEAPDAAPTAGTPAADAQPETPDQTAPPAPSGPRPAVLPPSRARADTAPSPANPGGVSLTGLSAPRPATRPSDFAATVEEIAEAEAQAQLSPYAVAQSERPHHRPGNMATIVASAQRTPDPAPSTQRSTAPAVAQPARPSGPTAQSVAARATQDNAIRLGQINLIGVYGTERSRRALVRLGNGRFVKVAVGDRLDGGRVAAIGSRTLVYNKGGRQVRLDIPG